MNKIYLTIILVMCILISGCSSKKEQQNPILPSENDTAIGETEDVEIIEQPPLMVRMM